MPLRTLITSATTAFVLAMTLALVTGYRAHEETRTVDFSTEPATGPAPVGALEAALAYAAANDLTDCVAPAHARLDDVVLTVPNDPKLVSSVAAVDFDRALRSGEEERWNVLSCRPPGGQ